MRNRTPVKIKSYRNRNQTRRNNFPTSLLHLVILNLEREITVSDTGNMVNLPSGIFRGLREFPRFFSIKEKLKPPRCTLSLETQSPRALFFFSSSPLIKRKNGIEVLPLERSGDPRSYFS